MPKSKGPAPPGKTAESKILELIETGWTPRRLRQLATEGYFPAPVDSYYETVPTLRGLFRYLNDQLHKKEDSLAHERKLLTRAKRKKADKELEILDKLWLAKDDVGPALRNISLHLRAELQRKLETELGPNLPGKTYLEIRPLLEQTVNDLCAIFHEGVKVWIEAKP